MVLGQSQSFGTALTIWSYQCKVLITVLVATVTATSDIRHDFFRVRFHAFCRKSFATERETLACIYCKASSKNTPVHNFQSQS